MSESGKKRVLGADQIFLPAASFPFMPRIVDRAHVECRSERLHFLSGKVTTLSTSSAFGLDRRGDVASFSSTTAFLFAEDLILAEDRTTERDRKKITEGEEGRVRAAFEMASKHVYCIYVFIFES